MRKFYGHFLDIFILVLFVGLLALLFSCNKQGVVQEEPTIYYVEDSIDFGDEDL